MHIISLHVNPEHVIAENVVPMKSNYVFGSELCLTIVFFRKTASVFAPKLSCLIRRLLRGGESPLEWRIADVTPIPKGP